MHATVDVFDEWPARALYGVAVKKMQTNKIVHSVSGALLKVKSQTRDVYLDILKQILNNNSMVPYILA